VAVFTFVHELGHALTARRIGCRAEIALDFMVAYAAYHPPRQLKWHERALIAISGPALQAMASIVFLLGMGIHPFSRESIGSSNAAIAVWWAGLALGAINLVPVLPLDGGAVVASLLDAVTGGRGRHVMVRVSIVVTAAITATLLASGNASFLPILVFLLFMQIQMLRAERIISSLSVDPAGDPQQDSLIADMLLEDGQHQHALSFARHAYTLCPAASTAVVAARACARLNNFSDAGQWLLAAEASSLNLTALGTLLEQSPEFHAMRTSPAFVALCRRVDAHPTY
jgi:Zn-dependent protease